MTIREVLAGTSDPFLAQAKNKWADPVEPGTVKGKQAVVIEHRDLPLEMSTERELKIFTPSDDPDRETLRCKICTGKPMSGQCCLLQGASYRMGAQREADY
jgi:hypothetical protein